MAIAVMGDDESASSLILRLSSLGFDAIYARRGSRAFAKVLEAADLILCASPREVADTVQATGRPPAPVVLVNAGLPDADGMLNAMRHGVIDVVTTPIDDGEFGERIETDLARARPTDLRIAGQLDNLERDQRAGRYIQLRMLPPSPMAIDRYRLAHRVQPSMILSGDFVDYFRIADRHFVFYIADVSGHGASSAFVTVILKNFSRRIRREYHPRMFSNPGEILGVLNRELLDQSLGKHVAMFIGVVDLDTDTLRFANAGHFPHAIHAVNGGGETRFLEKPGKPVGLFDDVDYDIGSADFAPGDSLVAFSDGVLEVMREVDLATKEQRLIDAARDHGPDIEALWRSIGIGNGSPGPDDMTCLVIAREA
ncbi:MAG: SpoIIE family protein phosphatase [Gammaproteobacteria bacterium]|nr:SpoIIE family protein phosphatase [Gammaproteobacteria bacterium]